MVKFRVKYKHRKASLELEERHRAGTLTEDELTAFVMGLVIEWDFKDADTGDPIPPGQPDELTLEQYEECMEEFSKQMNSLNTVPKPNAAPSSSGSKLSKRAAKNSHLRPTG